MVLQIVAGAAWLIWLTSGTAGLENSLMVGALLVVGFSARNLLDTFWRVKAAEKKVRSSGDESANPYRLSPRKKMALPSPHWSRAPADVSGSSSIRLRRLELR